MRIAHLVIVKWWVSVCDEQGVWELALFTLTVIQALHYTLVKVR
jgi:hypothetical protein